MNNDVRLPTQKRVANPRTSFAAAGRHVGWNCGAYRVWQIITYADIVPAD